MVETEEVTIPLVPVRNYNSWEEAGPESKVIKGETGRLKDWRERNGSKKK